jgi:hypothetical protein
MIKTPPLIVNRSNNSVHIWNVEKHEYISITVECMESALAIFNDSHNHPGVFYENQVYDQPRADDHKKETVKSNAIGKDRFDVCFTAAGPCCQECGRGFYCWLGPDESPCRHKLEEFSEKSLREYLVRVPGNNEVKKFLDKSLEETCSNILHCPDCNAELYSNGTYLEFGKHAV